MRIDQMDRMQAYVLELDVGEEVLFSYHTPVAARFGGREYRTARYWSVTTSKHINRFLIRPREAAERPQAWFDRLLTMRLSADRDSSDTEAAG